MAGSPNLRTERDCTSMVASCPVACHFSSSWSYGVAIRLAYVRRRLRSDSSASFTCGPVGAAGFTGIGGRPSGIRTAPIVGSFTQSKPVTNVASSGVRVSCRDRPDATSAT